jgi:predicted nucleic-acid-binding Zn-ribbon protein
MFNRIGTPVSLDVLNFKNKDVTHVKCAGCESIVGRRNGSLVKFSNSTVVVVSPEKFICPKCGKANTFPKE